MIGTLLFSMASLGALSAAEECRQNLAAIVDDPTTPLMYSEPPTNLAAVPEVYGLNIGDLVIPVPVASYDRITVSEAEDGINILALRDTDDQYTLIFKRMDAEQNLSLGEPSMFARTMESYSITAKDIDCDGPAGLWLKQILLMRAKGLAFPGNEQAAIYRMPHGWLAEERRGNQYRWYTTYELESRDVIDVIWSLPAEHPGMIHTYLNPSQAVAAPPESLTQFAECVDQWSLECLEQLEDFDLGILSLDKKVVDEPVGELGTQSAPRVVGDGTN